MRSGSGALFWWLHDDGDGPGQLVSSKKGRRDSLIRAPCKCPAAGGCSGSPRLAATDRGPSIQLTTSILENFPSALVTWFCFFILAKSQAEQVDEWVNTQTLDKLRRAEL